MESPLGSGPQRSTVSLGITFPIKPPLADKQINMPASSTVSFAPPPAVLSKHLDSLIQSDGEPTFAFARLRDAVCLVQLAGQTTPLDPSSLPPLLDVLVFRHEFASMFRYSYSARVHPLELRVLESLDGHAVRYEPDNGTVFLAKDLMAHLKRILDAAAMFNRTHHHRRSAPPRQWC